MQIDNSLIEALRIRILEKIQDLNNKIKTEEHLPHGPQDYLFLCEIEDRIEECLHNWHY